MGSASPAGSTSPPPPLAAPPPPLPPPARPGHPRLTLLALGAQVCHHDCHLLALDGAAVVHAPGGDAAPTGGAIIPLQAEGKGQGSGVAPPDLCMTRPCLPTTRGGHRTAHGTPQPARPAPTLSGAAPTMGLLMAAKWVEK